MATSPEETTKPVLGETRARQGRFGRDVFWVLLISTILAAIGLFAAWMFHADDMAATEPFARGDANDAKMFSAPEPAPKIPQPETARSTRTQ